MSVPFKFNLFFQESIDLFSGSPGGEEMASVQDLQFLELMEKETAVVDGKLQMPLPFKETDRLHDNRENVRRRMAGTLKSLKPNDVTEAANFFQAMIDAGFVELVPDHERDVHDRFYLPVFPSSSTS